MVSAVKFARVYFASVFDLGVANASFKFFLIVGDSIFSIASMIGNDSGSRLLPSTSVALLPLLSEVALE